MQEAQGISPSGPLLGGSAWLKFAAATAPLVLLGKHEPNLLIVSRQGGDEAHLLLKVSLGLALWHSSFGGVHTCHNMTKGYKIWNSDRNSQKSGHPKLNHPNPFLGKVKSGQDHKTRLGQLS